jgi:hypothetical protein
MKTQKIISSSCLIVTCLFTLNSFAQLKVLNNGNVGVGTLTPLYRFNVVGDYGLFSNITGYPTSSALIRCNSVYSSVTTPDFTWWGNDQTGLYHPGANSMGIAIGGTQAAEIDNYNFNVYPMLWAYGGFTVGSDKRFKKNVQPLEHALDKILKLDGKSYSFAQEEFKEKKFPSGTTFGFIAQEVKEIIPEVVRTDAHGYYGVDYIALIPYLVESIKEQNKKIEELSSKLESQNNAAINPSGANESIPKLYQNNPNPFSQTTEIKCFIPSKSESAQLFIYDMQGTQIKKLSITNEGENVLTLKANEFKAGMYMYSLILNGKEIDTKRMILTD